MNSRNIVIGALAGLAVGTLFGALCNNSNQVSTIANEAARRGGRYSKGLKKALVKLLDALNEKVDEANEEGGQIMKKGQSEATRLKDKIEPLMN